MEEFTNAVTRGFNVEAADIQLDHNAIQEGKLLNLDMESQDFIDEYRRVISDESLPEAEDQLGHQNYIGMEVGIRRGDDAELHRATVRGRVTDDEGRPIGRPKIRSNMR